MKNSKYKRSPLNIPNKSNIYLQSISPHKFTQPFRSNIKNILNPSKSIKEFSLNSTTHFKKSPLRQTKTNISSNINLKCQYDQMVRQLFRDIDFDCSGFITLTKVSYYKKMPEKVFYFFGGIFQKIKKMGGVSEKIFISLCDEAFVQAKAQDLEYLLSDNIDFTKTMRFDNNKKSQKVIKHYKSYSKFEKRKNAFQNTPKKQYQNQNPDKRLSSLAKNKHTQNDDQIFRQLSLPKDQQCPKSHYYLNNKQTIVQSSNKQNVSYNSLKVKQISQRLDRQIKINKQFIYKKCLQP